MQDADRKLTNRSETRVASPLELYATSQELADYHDKIQAAPFCATASIDIFDRVCPNIRISRGSNSMTIRGFIRSAELLQDPASEDRVNLLAAVQGVGPGQPRKILIPFEILVAQDDLDPDQLAGRAFRAEILCVENGTGIIAAIEVGPGRILRESE